MNFKCCNGCKPPKRCADPNCHETCEEYKIEKVKYEAEKAAKRKKKAVEDGITLQLRAGAARRARNRRK